MCACACVNTYVSAWCVCVRVCVCGVYMGVCECVAWVCACVIVRGTHAYNTHPNSSCKQRPTGVKVQGIQVGAPCCLRVQEGSCTAKGMKQQLHCIQFGIWQGEESPKNNPLLYQSIH